MRRREFITLFGSAAAWPLAVRAQRSEMLRIGFLHPAAPERLYVAALSQGLREIGYIEGQNVTIEYRWAEGHDDRLAGLAADLVRRQVAVIFAGPNASALAAKAATTTIPIVFAIGSDPVKIGLVASLARPGGNVTGVSFLATALMAKRMGLLHDIAPQAAAIAVLINPSQPDAKDRSSEAEKAARALAKRLVLVTAETESEIDQAFATLIQQHADALIVDGDPFLFDQRKQLIALAARHAVPTIYAQCQFPMLGGLASYGTDLAAAYRRACVYVGRILKGDKSADLPVEQSSEFELVLNLKTAKALGLTIPEPFLLTANEVIE
jgi:putative ABC transport system substrate-binding protein